MLSGGRSSPGFLAEAVEAAPECGWLKEETEKPLPQGFLDTATKLLDIVNVWALYGCESPVAGPFFLNRDVVSSHYTRFSAL